MYCDDEAHVWKRRFYFFSLLNISQPFLFPLGRLASSFVDVCSMFFLVPQYHYFMFSLSAFDFTVNLCIGLFCQKNK